MSQEAQDLQSAFALHRGGKLDEAAKLYRKVIKRNPRSVHALHSLGLIEAGQGNLTEAARLMSRSLLVEPTNVPFIENYATVLCQLGDFKTALEVAQKGAGLDTANKRLLYVSATSLLRLQRLNESLAQFDRLLSQEPNHIGLLNERSIVLAEMKHYDAALENIEKAISIEPRFADSFLNKGVFCAKAERHDEAIVAFQKALSLNPRLGNAWLGYANSSLALCCYDEALAAYDKALSSGAEADAVWLGRGNALLELRRFQDALQSYDRVLGLRPDSADAWLGIGNVFRKLRDFDKALPAFDKALAVNPHLETGWLGRGGVLYDLNRYGEAIGAYDKALALDPGLLTAETGRLNAKLRLCDWDRVSSEIAHLVEANRNNKDGTDPFTFLGLSTSAEEQLDVARRWVRKACPPSAQPLWKGETYQHDRIRIAYVSADFREHAIAYLTAGLFENHDRSKFEVTGIAIGPNDNSPTRRRIENAFERFIDAAPIGDSEIAAQIRSAEIDILIDLTGFTQSARTNILARRPAPIQVNYLGYPGTMGADYVDYIMADPLIIPSSQMSNYTEKVVYLPNTYQANDAKRVISDKAFTKEELGIPPDAFVFCCFNNNYKIFPDVFDGWMRILAKVPGSVLWLFEGNAATGVNLKKQAEARGISPERIIFARPMLLADHLARHRLADLFLDTLPYNAHTTASDTLWAGLPILTRIGTTFAGRVAASLLSAIRLPELITETQDDYERLAVELATDRDKLAALKRKLADNRLTMPLFETALMTRHIEAAYDAMHERHRSGLPPDHIKVPG